MPAVMTQIQISKCSDCPFYERGVVSAVADFLLKRDPGIRTGFCRFNGYNHEFPIGRTKFNLPIPLGRTHVPDETQIPEACPLRAGSCELTVKAKP
jgi:hypothetical protein